MYKIIGKDWINPKIEIRDTIQKGRGMFAVEPINVGEKILVWGGNYVSNKSKAEIERTNGKLVMQWDDNLFSVEDMGEDSGYFINHSCDSNTWMADVFTLIAKRNINLGEEITADYALWEADENYISRWKCECGAKVCRKKITGMDWRLPEVQKRYKNHFSPLINKRIASLKI